MGINQTRIEFWWKLEQFSGKLWLRLGNDRPSYWLDFLPAFCYRKRKLAERHGQYAR